MPNETTRLQARTQLALALIWLTPVMWSVNLISARLAPGVVSPHVLALGRWSLAGLILGWVARDELWRMRREVLASWRQCLVLGGCGMWICGAWLYLAG